MKRVVLLSCWLAAALSGAAQARECKGVAFPDHLQVNGNDLALNGLGMRKGDTAFVAFVNKALLEMEKNGEARRIYDKWFTATSGTPRARNFTITAGK